MFSSTKYTEADTEKFYDEDDKFYRSFWDENGSLHWGYFTKQNQNNFLEATLFLTKKMAEKAKIDARSYILDVGCGNGEVALTMAKQFGSTIIGIDISGVRIGNANNKLKQESAEIQKRVKFIKASATQLPFETETFSHVWSQATIYHVHDKQKCLQEIYRVLRRGGIFVFDDLLKPREDISKDAQEYIYKRLLFDTPFSFDSYKDTLQKIGFEILDSEDLSSHLQRSYELLTEILENKIETEADKKKIEKFNYLIRAYLKTVNLIKDGELGWGFYLCKKI